VSAEGTHPGRRGVRRGSIDGPLVRHPHDLRGIDAQHGVLGEPLFVLRPDPVDTPAPLGQLLTWIQQHEHERWLVHDGLLRPEPPLRFDDRQPLWKDRRHVFVDELAERLRSGARVIDVREPDE